MLNSLLTFFHNTSSDEAQESQRVSLRKHIIYRDELSNTKPKAEKRDFNSLESSEPLIRKEERRGAVRVKVLMTKQEANRLLSRCKDGGELEFRDVARELANVPAHHVTVVGAPSAVLKTIHEEF